MGSEQAATVLPLVEAEKHCRADLSLPSSLAAAPAGSV